MSQTLTMALRSPLRRALVDFNPFYLLSAMCMLAGLFALNDSLNWSPLPQANLLWLILILNIYEMLLIGLGIFLARLGLVRDAATLLVLEAFFLVDAGFLNSEIFNARFQLGLLVNIVLFALAGVKVAAVFIGLRIRISDPRLPLVMAQILVLTAMPGFFKQVSERHAGSLPALAIYTAWWVIGLIPVIYVILLRKMEPVRHGGIVGAFIILPMISILAHLCTANWIYHVRWYHENLSPLLLGMAVAVGACDWHVRSLSARMRLQLILPILAIAVALGYRVQLVFWMDDLPVTPLRLTLLAASLVYLHGLLLYRHPYFGAAAGSCLALAGLGHTPEAMATNVASGGDRGISALWRLVPRTVMQWGIVSVTSSFVLLGIGLLLSLSRFRQTHVSEAMTDDDINVS